MKTLPKWTLAFAVTGLVVGTFVTFSHRELALAWGLVMPLGVILTGLFLITLALQNEAVNFDEDERLKMESAERLGYSIKGKKRTNKLPDAPGDVKSMDRMSSTPQSIKIGTSTI